MGSHTQCCGSFDLNQTVGRRHHATRHGSQDRNLAASACIILGIIFGLLQAERAQVTVHYKLVRHFAAHFAMVHPKLIVQCPSS